MPARIFVVVPVLNEAQNIGRFLEGVGALAKSPLAADHSVQLILVDDGSTDGTAEKARSAPPGIEVQVLRHETNRGPGAAFGTAFEYLHSRWSEEDLVFTIEGDNTSRIETAVQMLTRLREGYDAVLASPYAYGGGIEHTSWYRVVLSHGANSFLKSLIGLHGFHTMSSFFRLYRAGLLQRLQGVFGPRIVERNGFESMVELLIKMVLLKPRISEVEMRLDTSQRAGKSKMKIFKTLAGYLALLPLRRSWEKKTHAHVWTYAN